LSLDFISLMSRILALREKSGILICMECTSRRNLPKLIKNSRSVKYQLECNLV
jgi:hypothetical protein